MYMSSGKAIVIGSGFAGLSAASFLAKSGWDVTVLEKQSSPGGRARQFSEKGFRFDMGPSWYWMPDVFERYFQQFGKNVSSYYSLKRLDPSYRVYRYEENVDIPGNYEALRKIFEKFESGSAIKLDQFIEEAAYKYNVGMKRIVYKPGLSFREFIDWDLIKGLVRLDVFTPMKKHIDGYFKHPFLRQLLYFPVLFLGAMPEHIPALYSLMNYADMVEGTWYPEGGMYTIVHSMYTLAKELGVNFRFNESVEKIQVTDGLATGVSTKTNHYPADVVVGAADYHFIEDKLLEPVWRSYSEDYWKKKTMAPSCLLYYVGLNKKLANLRHHSLFFDAPFDLHAQEIYKSKRWPSNPLFYVCAPSVTDASVAPPECENLFFLIPVAAGLEGDTEALREKYFEEILLRMENQLQQSIRESIVYKKSFATNDFISEYNAYKGNAYGLANTLSQTAILKPKCRSKKVRNLFYTGQLTVPGPGVPPSLISGEIVVRELLKEFNH